MRGWASGPAVTPADGRVPAGFEPPSAPGYRSCVRVCWGCVHVWWCASSVWRVPRLLGQSRLSWVRSVWTSKNPTWIPSALGCFQKKSTKCDNCWNPKCHNVEWSSWCFPVAMHIKVIVSVDSGCPKVLPPVTSWGSVARTSLTTDGYNWSRIQLCENKRRMFSRPFFLKMPMDIEGVISSAELMACNYLYCHNVQIQEQPFYIAFSFLREKIT